jgi:hypothetical protein
MIMVRHFLFISDEYEELSIAKWTNRNFKEKLLIWSCLQALWVDQAPSLKARREAIIFHYFAPRLPIKEGTLNTELLQEYGNQAN